MAGPNGRRYRIEACKGHLPTPVEGRDPALSGCWASEPEPQPEPTTRPRPVPTARRLPGQEVVGLCMTQSRAAEHKFIPCNETPRPGFRLRGRVVTATPERRLRQRRRTADRRRRQPHPADQRRRLRGAVRRQSSRGVLWQDRPASAQPRRGPPSQRRAAPHRAGAAALASAHPRRRRPPHRPRQDSELASLEPRMSPSRRPTGRRRLPDPVLAGRRVAPPRPGARSGRPRSGCAARGHAGWRR
jgi:hypothetical protein